MMVMQKHFVAGVWRRLRTTIAIRFSRFAGASILALLASTAALSACDGLLHMSSTWAAVISWLCGASVSYILSRWAWARKGRPNVLRETLPFLGISVLVVIVLSLAAKLGYALAAELHLHGVRHVAVVELVYVSANFGTFLMRFVFFHYALFKDRAKVAVAPQRATSSNNAA